MKKLLFIITVFLHTQILFAQSPQGISYQAVVRNLSGTVLSNKSVDIKISILKGSTSGSAEYVEQHTVTTNQFGLINLVIGQGTALQGTFSNIDWGANKFFTKVEMDIKDGNGYQLTGINQMLSVPYSLYSLKAGSAPQDYQALTISNDTLYLSNGGSVYLGDLRKKDQQLSLKNDTLYLTNGGNVFLGDLTDSMPLDTNTVDKAGIVPAPTTENKNAIYSTDRKGQPKWRRENKTEYYINEL